ncbi:hypothetical protein HZC07_03715 [Candidatus Micrarchaeota archaeon]|nr:hypothetical protein [Candidatus Micrarchaeota archaeon]
MGAISRWPSKIWHEEKIKEFIIKAKNQDYEILLFAGPNESEKHKKFSDDLKKQNEIKEGDSTQVIRRKASQYISATTLADKVHANFQCLKCGTSIGLLVGSNVCPTCTDPI